MKRAGNSREKIAGAVIPSIKFHLKTAVIDGRIHISPAIFFGRLIDEYPLRIPFDYADMLVETILSDYTSSNLISRRIYKNIEIVISAGRNEDVPTDWHIYLIWSFIRAGIIVDDGCRTTLEDPLLANTSCRNRQGNFKFQGDLKYKHIPFPY